MAIQVVGGGSGGTAISGTGNLNFTVFTTPNNQYSMFIVYVDYAMSLVSGVTTVLVSSHWNSTGFNYDEIRVGPNTVVKFTVQGGSTSSAGYIGYNYVEVLVNA